MAKLIIFDMGGVVCTGVFEFMDILTEQGLKVEHTAVYREGLMERYSRGEMEEPEFWEEFNRLFGTGVISPRWGKTFRPVMSPEVTAVIRRLSESHRVVCGTNTIDPHWKIHESRGDYSIFHRVYASHRIGLVKPDPEFWRHILREESFLPEDTLFVDDFPENAAAAETLGIRSHLYREPRDLEAFLREHVPA